MGWLKDLFTAHAVPEGAPTKLLPIIDTTKMGAPWMDWMIARDGKSENDPAFSAEMSKYWPLVGLHFANIQGRSHAWCALTVNAALHDTGYKGNGSAAAVSFEHYGTPCGYVYGAIVPIRHASGEHHVTFFDHWADEPRKIACLFGGNQSNCLRKQNFDLSGNKNNGADECVSGPRWPVKA